MNAHIRCDLHMHTFYSDGRASPRELVAHAASMGLRTIAITDHDTAQGAREGIPAAEQYGIAVLPAIEFTCRWDASNAPPGKADIDVLGYCLDLENARFRAMEQAALADIHARVNTCCALLTAGGYPIALNEVFAQNPRYAGMMPLMDALIHKGHAQDSSAAIAAIDVHWRQVRPSALTIADIITTIHAAGGVGVLAHPTLVPWETGWLSAQGLAALVDMGLDGIEIHHHRLDGAARVHFSSLAQQFSLLITGGSDEHGWPSGFPHMGNERVTQEMADALAARARERS